FKSKVVSRVHAEIWLKDGQVYLKDVGSSSGTFLNKMRLSPANKRSRPYPLRQGDLIQLGVDYQGRTEEIYKAVELRVEITIDDHQIREQQQQIPLRFRKALNQLLVATNPYASMDNHEHEHDKSQDCCICLAEIGPFQALFIAPCSHCFHYKCIKSVLRDCLMFPCPVCRQVANLDASVSME
ncbi:SMAD/FHA domain-containing protein, partial [Gorgonomyces haynaldii]